MEYKYLELLVLVFTDIVDCHKKFLLYVHLPIVLKYKTIGIFINSKKLKFFLTNRSDLLYN